MCCCNRTNRSPHKVAPKLLIILSGGKKVIIFLSYIFQYIYIYVLTKKRPQWISATGTAASIAKLNHSSSRFLDTSAFKKKKKRVDIAVKTKRCLKTLAMYLKVLGRFGLTSDSVPWETTLHVVIVYRQVTQ